MTLLSKKSNHKSKENYNIEAQNELNIPIGTFAYMKEYSKS